jgi:hypothetical protein
MLGGIQLAASESHGLEDFLVLKAGLLIRALFPRSLAWRSLFAIVFKIVHCNAA